MSKPVVVNIYPFHVDIELKDGGYQSPDYDECVVHLGDDPTYGSVPLKELIAAYCRENALDIPEAV